MNKKNVIVLGIAIGALVYLLTRKPKLPDSGYKCSYCGPIFFSIEDIKLHVQTKHPNNPQIENYGRLWGYVQDAVTLSPVIGAEIYLDGILDNCFSRMDGLYVTNHVPLGIHSISVKADGYEYLHFKTTITQKDTELNIILSYQGD